MKVTPQVEVDIENRRYRVADMYLRGHSQRHIARQLGVTQPTICLDLQAIRREWKESMIRDFDEAKARELEKIDTVEREAWAAWERSQADAERRKTGFNSQGPVDETTVAGQYGDAKFLDVVMNCIKRRCDLLGLDAPVKVANTDADGNDITPDQRRTGLLGILATLRQRAGIAADSSEPYGHDGSAVGGEQLT